MAWTGRWGGPYIVVDGPHNTVLGLLDSHIKTLGLAVTSGLRRGMAYGAVRIHLDDGLAWFVLPGIHLSRRSGRPCMGNRQVKASKR